MGRGRREEREKLEVARTPDRPGEDAGEVIAALRGLYAQALGAAPVSLVEPVERAVDRLEAEAPEVPEAAGSRGAAEMRLERIPGRFGAGQYRRVRVEKP
jgi:hypothetical protein